MTTRNGMGTEQRMYLTANRNWIRSQKLKKGNITTREPTDTKVRYDNVTSPLLR